MDRSLYTYLFLLVLSLQACGQKAESSKEATTQQAPISFELNKDFGDYWYQGKAELASYELTQVRYGEKREGDAVLIFVTEDFSESKQVKLDRPSQNPEDVQKVMKLNFTKKFETGIYPYSIMTSTFSPVYPEQDLHAVKVTTSVQEWCGHVFMQLNKKGSEYETLIRSYFESEGDQNSSIHLNWNEDELWNMIRLSPASIPSGNTMMIPSTMFLRLKHLSLRAYKATIKKDVKGETTVLKLNYPALKRSMSITYETAFPHSILSWEESYPEADQMMTTSGKLKEKILLDYWNKNSNADSIYRKQLKLAH